MKMLCESRPISIFAWSMQFNNEPFFFISLFFFHNVSVRPLLWHICTLFLSCTFRSDCFQLAINLSMRRLSPLAFIITRYYANRSIFSLPLFCNVNVYVIAFECMLEFRSSKLTIRSDSLCYFTYFRFNVSVCVPDHNELIYGLPQLQMCVHEPPYRIYMCAGCCCCFPFLSQYYAS